MDYKEHLKYLVLKHNVKSDDESKIFISEICKSPNNENERFVELKSNGSTFKWVCFKNNFDENTIYEELYLYLIERFFEMISHKDTCSTFSKRND